MFGALGIDTGHFDHLIHREIGEIFLRDHAFLRQQARRLIVHAFKGQQILDVMLESFLGRDRLRQQCVARAAPQFVDGIFVERLDFEHLVERHISNLFQGAESFLHQDIGDLRKRVREIEDGITKKQSERLKLEHELQNPSIVFLSGELREDTPRLSELRTNLTGLEQQKTVILIDLKEGHPDVKKLQAQIDRVRDAMQEEERREQARQQERHIGEVNKIHDTLRLIADEIGIWLMFCMPPATIRSAVPDMMACAPKEIACWLEPHCRSTVTPGTSSG